MGKIVLLDDLTINKIAAGEVIERPASVVKEMVENSIDAGANKITIEVKNGGITYIKVTDNGKGIAQDDLEIAFERHATSKIRSANDLDSVTSMGFRGEALASIAAVSTVELVSKTAEQENGYKLVIEAGDIVEKGETGCPNGTSITVTDLFFNTPVRYKFLKKDYTEMGYIEDVVTRIALVNPNIAFKLINSGKTIIQTTGNGDLKSVVYSIYGRDIADAVLPVSYTYEDITVTGVIGKPEIARSNRTTQLFFVNKRYIKDKILYSATEQSYKGLIPIGKFGFVILNIEMSPSKVDVNVHPAKLEVRFEEENKVFQAIYHSIKETLLKSDLVKNVSRGKIDMSSDEIQKQMNRREKSFEQRLAEKMKEKELEKEKGKGLFGKTRGSKQIREYTKEESKMKTNNIIEDLYQSKTDEEIDEYKTYNEYERNNETTKEETMEVDAIPIINPGETLNTEDVLMELKKMRAELQQELGNTTDSSQLSNSVTEGININKIVNDVDNIDLTDEARKALDAKVESFLGNASKIKEKNQKIINGEYSPEENKIEEILNKNTISSNMIKIPTIEELQQANENKIDGIENKEENILEKINPVDIQQQEEKLEYIEEKINQIEENPNTNITEEFKEMYAKLFGTVLKTEDEIKQEEQKKKVEEKINAVDIIKDNISLFEEEEDYELPTYKYIGIAFKTYIIIEMDKELYIIDQHAAHERIMYEKVKKNYYNDSNKDSQMMLLPDIITLTHKEMAIARENWNLFEKAGFTLDEFGDNTVKITGCPSMCMELDTEELFLETLDEINTVARTAKQEKEEKFIATVACKAAIKAHMALDEKEVVALLDKLLRLPNPFTCPHGRPTAIKMTQYDIERKFSRK